MGLIPVPNQDLATVVTALEMRERPRPRPMPLSQFRLVRWKAPDSTRYLELFRRVGGPWLWYSRLTFPDAKLRVILDDPQVHVYAAVDRAGIEIGMVELDFRTEGQCSIVYFGLIPELAGQGHGHWLMAHTLAIAWAKGVTKVLVSTCTLDHPAALNFYRKNGFVAVRRSLETFPDPRLIGLLPAESAPHIPCLVSR